MIFRLFCTVVLILPFLISSLSAPITENYLSDESENEASSCTVCMETYHQAEISKLEDKDFIEAILDCGEWGYHYGLICIEAVDTVYSNKTVTNESDNTEAESFCQKYCSGPEDYEIFHDTDDFLKYENYSSVIVALILAKQYMCGVTYTNAMQSYMMIGTKWSKNHLTYAISNESLVLPLPSIRSSLEFAFTAWSDVIPMNFSEVSSLETADIKVYFISEKNSSLWDFPRGQQTAAYALSPPAGKIYFNTDYQWTDSFGKEIGRVNFIPFAIHEIGHVLGLTHSRDCSSIMSPNSRNGSLVLPVLIEEDIVRIQRIYGPREIDSSASDMPCFFIFKKNIYRT